MHMIRVSTGSAVRLQTEHMLWVFLFPPLYLMALLTLKIQSNASDDAKDKN